jgi:hypothetical protein
MKFGQLRSIGHNIADSLAGGVGLMIGVYELDVFGEAAAGSAGYILVDFMTGASHGSPVSANLAAAIALYAQALDGLCQRHGLRAEHFQELTARYSLDVNGPRFVVTVADKNGRYASDEYLGVPGTRPRELDALGRVRTRRYRTPAGRV